MWTYSGRTYVTRHSASLELYEAGPLEPGIIISVDHQHDLFDRATCNTVQGVLAIGGDVSACFARRRH